MRRRGQLSWLWSVARDMFPRPAHCTSAATAAGFTRGGKPPSARHGCDSSEKRAGELITAAHLGVQAPSDTHVDVTCTVSREIIHTDVWECGCSTEDYLQACLKTEPILASAAAEAAAAADVQAAALAKVTSCREYYTFFHTNDLYTVEVSEASPSGSWIE